MNVVKNILGKNLYRNTADVEKDYKLANRYAKISKREYYDDALEATDVTSSDKKLLRQWLKR